VRDEARCWNRVTAKAIPHTGRMVPAPHLGVCLILHRQGRVPHDPEDVGDQGPRPQAPVGKPERIGVSADWVRYLDFLALCGRGDIGGYTQTYRDAGTVFVERGMLSVTHNTLLDEEKRALGLGPWGLAPLPRRWRACGGVLPTSVHRVQVTHLN